MSLATGNRGLTDEERRELENKKKKLEQQYAIEIKQKIEEIEKDPAKADELNKIIAEVKKIPLFSCNARDTDSEKMDIQQIKKCLGYFIDTTSKSAYSGLTIGEAAENSLFSLYKSVMKQWYRPSTSVQEGKGGKRSRKYKRKSIKKLRKKSRRYIKKK